MTRIFGFITLAFLMIFVTSCSSDLTDVDNSPEGLSNSDSSFDSSSSGESSGSSSGESGGGTNEENSSGLITAAEWNDLENWDFWVDLLETEDYREFDGQWDFYTSNRISLLVLDGNAPVSNAKIELKKDGTAVWNSRSDNFGRAESWINAFENDTSIDLEDYRLFVNDKLISQLLHTVEGGVNHIQVDNSQSVNSKMELAFIVDATGSMSDEIRFLQDDLEDVIQRVQQNNIATEIQTASVFYRDEGDEYVFRKSEFSDNIQTTISFVNEQGPNGGGDYPEAVHTGLEEGIENLAWSEDAKTRIAFLVLDAPPHKDPQVISSLQSSIRLAAEKGIKVIPVTASGIDKETEFLMRCFSILTNSTYVFITNDSGIGNEHLEASVGEHEIEFLNDLMVRLINEYSE